MKKLFILTFFSFAISSLFGQDGTIMNSSFTQKDSTRQTEIFDRAEVMPKFPGGTEKLFNFLNQNIRYPSLAVENNLQGKVIIKFAVDIDGSVIDPMVLKDGVGGGCGEEAIRVIKAMPKWLPGSQQGKPVMVYYTLPVTFKLSNEEPIKKPEIVTKLDAIFRGGNVQLEFYKQEILSKIKKSKKEKTKQIKLSILITINEFGKVEDAKVINDNTDNKKNKDIIISELKSMPNWIPATLNGKTITTQKILTFEY